MEFFILGKQIKDDYENKRYTFRIYLFGFIPMIMVCDWNDPESKGKTEGKAWREYYFMGFPLYIKEFKTKIETPKSRY